MKLYLLAGFLIIAVAKECTKARERLPLCIQQKIDAIKKEPKWNPPAEVTQYLFRGKTVYLFSSNCCDQYNVLYDENCNYVCAPSGGFTGKGDQRCAGFKDSAQQIKLVWKDSR